MTRFFFAAICLASFCMVSRASEVSSADEFRTRAIDMVNEVSSRRRTTLLFENYQNPRYGERINFVNSFKGNLSFVIRDSVARAVTPIVVGRVYDSSIQRGDFGPGWKLSLTESISISGDRIAYRDATNSEYVLYRRRGGMLASAFLPSLKGEISPGRIVLRDTAFKRVFKRLEGEFLLDRIESLVGGDSIDFEYSRGRLTRVSNQFTTLEFSRNSDGFISEITSSDGVELQYDYSQQGLLDSVTQSSRVQQTYAYGSQGMLDRIMDPDGEVISEFSFWPDGRAAYSSVMGVSREFAYRNLTTQISSDAENDSFVRHSVSGEVVGVQTAAGDRWRVAKVGDRQLLLKVNGNSIAQIGFHPRNRRPTRLVMSRDGAPIRYEFRYNSNGHLSSLGSSVAGESIDARYTGEGVTLYSEAGDEEHISIGGSGLVSRFRQNEKGIELEWNDRGSLEMIRDESGRATELNYNESHQIREIAFPEGITSAYEYESTGLRDFSSYSNGALVDWRYDSLGNLSGIRFEESGELIREDSYRISGGGRLDAITSSAGPGLDFDYDGEGRIERVSAGTREMTVSYDEYARVDEIELDGKVVAAFEPNESQMDPVLSEDDVTSLAVLPLRAGAGIYGSANEIVFGRPSYSHRPLMYFDQGAMRFFVLGAKTALPYSFEKSILHRIGAVKSDSEWTPRPWLLDKPSNALFIPPEFVAVNCYICLGIVLNHNLTLNGESQQFGLVGTPVNVDSDSQVEMCYDPTAGFGFGTTADMSLSYGDGGFDFSVFTALPFLTFLDLNRTKTYSAPGTYSITSNVGCSCNIFAFGAVTRDIFISAIPIPVQIKLTYDDGPSGVTGSNNNTGKVLTALAGANPVAANIPATFFVQTHVWNRGASGPGQANIAAAYAQGHTVGVHTGSTQDHVAHTVRVVAPPYLSAAAGGTNENALKDDMIRAKAYLAGVPGGSVPVYVRAPFGLRDSDVDTVYAEVGLQHVFWDVDTGDSTSSSNFASITAQLATQLVGELLSFNFDINILFHDIHSRTADNTGIPGGYIWQIDNIVRNLGPGLTPVWVAL
ncbi:MAG: polysaccharide deacetylase family protein [Pseudomonadota bacterium]